MILKHFFEPSLAQSSYLIGCGATGQALVLDPHIDVGQYLDAATAEGVEIVGVAETHIHADFVSGARALADATGGTLYVSGEGGPDWQYAFATEPRVRLLRDGDAIGVGRLRLKAVHTPGHTPEHLMFLLTDTPRSEAPLGAFTGDFLFAGDVGRPDLLDTAAGHIGTMEASARRLFASLQALTNLPDHLLIWPGHGSGSACGKSLSGVPVSSLGYERRTNWALLESDADSFVASVLADQPDPPMYFGEMKQVNRVGTQAWHPTPTLKGVDADTLRRLVAAGELLIDTRRDSAWGSVPGAIAIPSGRSFAGWAGSVVPPSTPCAIVAADEGEAAAARRILALVGRTDVIGWVSPEALAAYVDHGGRLAAIETATQPRADQAVVDVRSSAEWRDGHLDGAFHVPLARLPERMGGLDRSSPLLIYCHAGVRAQVAASALRRLGFGDVTILEGGLSGYRDRRRQEDDVPAVA